MPVEWGVWADRLVGVPLQILGILLAALLVRWLLHRLIRRVVAQASARHERRDTDRAVEGLRRAGTALVQASGLAHERYVARTQTLGAVLRSVVTVVVTTIALLTVMATLGIPLGPLLASAGVGGVALGFGAQSLVKDFLSGIFMIVEDQYGVGDTIDTGAAVGVVEDITLRVTRLRDATGVIWYIRNGEIVRIGNRSQGWSTASVEVPIALGASHLQAREVLRAALADLAETDDRVLDQPQVLTEAMAMGALVLRIVVKCVPTEYLDVQRDIRDRAKTALDAAGIEMAAAPVSPIGGWPGAAGAGGGRS
jgi:small conductance mechanosensitive channel